MFLSSPPKYDNGLTAARLNKSHAIPMPASHIHRTESEVQLHEDTAVAEYRDQCMFNRLVTGIRHRQHQCNGSAFHHEDCITSSNIIALSPVKVEFMEETQRSIENIISTRNHSAYFEQDCGEVTPDSSQHLHSYQCSQVLQIENNLEDWAIGGFDESSPDVNSYNDPIRTEAIPDMYESDDSSLYDDEVFYIDL